MDSGLLSLKWNNHGSTFFRVLETIRKKELYNDVTLACDGKFFPVHKLVLSTCSDYFQEMFEKTQCKHPVIVLKDIRYTDLESLLNYMYLGEVNVLHSELFSLIKAAECLRVKGLAVPDEPPPSRKASKRTLNTSNDREEVTPKRNNKRSISNQESSSQPSSNSSNKENVTENNNSDAQDKSSYVIQEVAIKEEEIDASVEPEETLNSITKFEASDIDTKEHSDLEPPDTNDAESSYYGNYQNDPDNSGFPSTSAFDETSNWSTGDIETIDGDGSMGDYDSSAFMDPSQANAQNMEGRSGTKANFDSEVYDLTDSSTAEARIRKIGDRYKCLFPNCAFFNVNKSNMRYHVLKHLNMKPYSCTFCNYKGRSKAHIQSHLKLKHGFF